jgi:hypothetical protein
MCPRPQNPNRSFLIGSAILAFAVIFIVVLFTMLSLRAISKSADEPVRYAEEFRFRFSPEWAGRSVSLYLNDSLFYEGVVPDVDTLRLKLGRFEEESALLVVDNESEKVSTFELTPEGGNFLIRKGANGVLVEPVK